MFHKFSHECRLGDNCVLVVTSDLSFATSNVAAQVTASNVTHVHILTSKDYPPENILTVCGLIESSLSVIYVTYEEKAGDSSPQLELFIRTIRNSRALSAITFLADVSPSIHQICDLIEHGPSACIEFGRYMVSDSDVSLISNAISKSRKIRELSFLRGCISHTGMKQIFTGAISSTSLVSLNIHENIGSPDVIDSLRTLLLLNQRIRTMYVRVHVFEISSTKLTSDVIKRWRPVYIWGTWVLANIEGIFVVTDMPKGTSLYAPFSALIVDQVYSFSALPKISVALFSDNDKSVLSAINTSFLLRDNK